MENNIENIEEILSNNVSGFHQYVLSDPIHLSFVSQNFCEMTGFSKDELLSESEDLYVQLVHSADREQYLAALYRLSHGEKKVTLQYRIVKKDGSIIYVSDILSVGYLEDGTRVAYSVLTDITALKNENNNLQFLNETIPCGFLKYTCEKQPKITYINEQMLSMLCFPETRAGELDYVELYKDNIFLMVPMEERRRFALYLNRVYTLGMPIAGEMTLLRCDGTRLYLFGWVTKCTNEQGQEEFQSVCMDITEMHHVKKRKETKRYIKALTDVYDKIFEYDRAKNTVKCLYGKKSEVFRWFENVPMQMEDATEKWIMSTVHMDDRDKVRKFFSDFYQKRLGSDSGPPQIQYRALSGNGEQKTYTGLFLKIDTSVSLFCCRNMPDVDEMVSLRSDNEALKNMQELVMHFTDGIAAFEVTDEYVTPLYSSDNVCEFFGFTKEEWSLLMKKNTPIKDFVTKTKVAHQDILDLLENGEAEFTYHDVATDTERNIKAICSQKTTEHGSPRYVMLYNVDDNSNEEEQTESGSVVIRTFGYFDVFVEGKPIAFRSQKAKELFALLVDRRGGYVSSEEAISFLWEDEPVSSVTLARYRKVALRLKNILEEYGIVDVVESVDGKRRIVTDKVKCDLYDYLSGKEEYAQIFKGNYLSNYSWSENTLAELMGENIFT